MTRILLGCGGLAALTGCTSTLTGNEGNFQFHYVTDDAFTDFNKPIAVGALLDVYVTEVGSSSPIDLSGASVDDTAVLDVVDFAANIVTLEGMGDGTALVSVEGAVSGGETLTDSVNMLSSVPEVLVLNHTCTTGADAAWLVGQRLWLPWEMEMENGQPVIGYGYYPAAFSDGTAALSDSDSGAVYLAIDTASVGTAELVSAIDSTTLSASVVEASAIDGVADPVAFVLEDIDVGDTNAFYALPMVGELTVCQAKTDKVVESLTPSICTVTDSDPDDTASLEEWGWFDVTGVAEGTCEFSVTYTAGNGGQGATETFTYPIEP